MHGVEEQCGGCPCYEMRARLEERAFACSEVACTIITKRKSVKAAIYFPIILLLLLLLLLLLSVIPEWCVGAFSGTLRMV